MGRTYPFVEYLQTLADDRAALAQLRRGLGQPPGTAVDMYRYVAAWVGPSTPRAVEEAYYLVAALYAAHPASGGSGNMGDHFRDVAVRVKDPTPVERRFNRLLTAHPDDLHFSLRQAVNYLRSHGVPVEWHQLLGDVLDWGDPNRFVQQRWATRFWTQQISSTPIQPETHQEV